MLFLKFVTVFVMLIGLSLTFAPRLPGAILILAAAFFYGAFTGFAGVETWLLMILSILAAVAEVGGRILRVVLTNKYALSRQFATDSTVGNVGGILAAEALLGPVVGLVVWELVAGKTLEPSWDIILKVLWRLFAAAALRFTCGLLMIILVIIYLF